MKKYLLLLLTCVALIACGDGDGGSKEQDSPKLPKQLNITVLLDLSDRIIRDQTPSQTDRDTTVIANLLDIYTKQWFEIKNFNFKGKFKVVFSPAPTNSNIAALADSLSIDAAALTIPQKKLLYPKLKPQIMNSLRQIYDSAANKKEWIGSDVWRFFQNDIQYYLEDSTEYRNIVVVLTDGYIYHQNTIFNEGNKYSYITSKLIKSKGLQKTNYEELIDKTQFGVMPCKGLDLKGAEVLFLELNPENNQFDYNIISKVLKEWCKEMNASKVECIKTNLPATTAEALKKIL